MKAFDFTFFIDSGFFKCNPLNSKNIRLRTSALIEDGDTTILIESGPDFRVQAIENKITKSNRYDVTLHKGKTPDQYDYLSWYDLLTSQQKQKIVNQIKTEKLRKNTFFILKPVDEENEVQPKFFKSEINTLSQVISNWQRSLVLLLRALKKVCRILQREAYSYSLL